MSWPSLQGGEREVSLRADPLARADIARDLALESLPRLDADLTIRPWLDGVEIQGRVEAVAGRRCGVSLELFDQVIDEPLLIRVVPSGSPNAPRSGVEVVVDLEAEDPPDEAEGDSVDLAAYVVEALALALDPFPRKPGAVFEPPEPTPSVSPFAALSKLPRRPLPD
jgi:hypothetical protein